MLSPADTGEGAPELVTDRLTFAFTTVFVVVELLVTLGSPLPEVTEAFAVIVVPSAVAAFTFRIRLIFVTDPAARLAFVHVTAPVPPTMGVTQLQPGGNVNAWKVVFAGTVSK